MAKRFEDSDVLVMDDESTECAWCNEEQGRNQGSGSHGICTPHREKLELNYQLHKYNRVPSYVERFRKR